jgi:HEAT repeat protein
MSSRWTAGAAIGAVLLGGVGVAGVWWAQAGTPTDATATSAASQPGTFDQAPDLPRAALAASPPVAVSAASSAAATALGFDLRYRFELGHEGAATAMRLEARGRLELAPERDGWIRARVVAPTAVSNPAATRALGLGAHDAALEHPWAMRVEPDGRVAEVRFADATPDGARAVLAAVAHAWQHTKAANPAATRWETTESDTNGAYVASYERDAGTVTKHWTIPADRVAFRGETTVEYTFRGEQLTTVAFDQHADVNVHGSGDAASEPYRLTIDLEATSAGDGAWSASVSPETLQPFDATHLKAQVKAAPVVAPPFDETLDEVRARATRADPAARVQLRNHLAAAISAEPGASARIASLIRVGALADSAQTVAIAALATAQTPEAQSALGELCFDDALANVARHQALAAVTLMSRPSAQLVATLTRFATSDDSLAPAAAAAAAAAASKLVGVAPTDAKAATDAIVSAAREPILAGRDPNVHSERAPVAVRGTWVSALGNTADSAALPLILNALQDPDAAVRGRAAFALRFQSPKSCIEAMTDRMARESSVTVRGRLLMAAAYMGTAAMGDFVERALLTDTSPFVRNKAALVISVWSETAPGLRKVLSEALKRESDPWAAEQLQSLMTPGNTAGLSSVEGVRADEGPEEAP